MMRAVDVIRKKRLGLPLEKAEIDEVITGATSGRWPDYQVSAWLMTIVWRGMTRQETDWLTQAMVGSGVRLNWDDLPGPKVDKHSTGGVGDKTSLIVAPLAAACGVIVPMMSGRALGHTGGTLDKLESIPGFRVGLSLVEFREKLSQLGCAIISQTDEIAPADKKLYALRDVTATVDSIPLISASIMSKKIAEGIDGLVLDVKCGRGAFMKDLAEARELAKSMIAIGKANGVRTEALITAMDAPLGRAVGNSLEVIECVETLKGQGPSDLERLSLELVARMLRLAGNSQPDHELLDSVRTALASGRGLEKFREMVEQQGGDPRVVDEYDRLPAAPERGSLAAEASGYVTEIDAELVGRGAMSLGAGRDRASDRIDPSVGVILRAQVGDRVRSGDSLMEVHYRDSSRFDIARPLLAKACRIGESAPPRSELILERCGEV